MRDGKSILSCEARRWILENVEVVEALAIGMWKATPIEPTYKMLCAPSRFEMHDDEIWAAMLAAAPAKPGDAE